MSPIDDVPGKLQSDRLREWSVVVVDRYTGLPRELRVTARGFGEAGFLAHAEMTPDETIDSIAD